MRARATWLSDEEKRLIVGEAFDLLERVGIRMAGSQSLGRLAEAGLLVDTQTDVVRFPPDVTAELLKRCPRDVVLAGADPDHDVILAEGAPPRFSSSGCAAFTIDHRTGERRPSTLGDLRDATVLLDASTEVDVVWTTVAATDVPLERREALEYFTVLAGTRKHVTLVNCPSATGPLVRMLEVVCGDLERFRRRPRVSTLFTVASPFQLDGRLLDFHAGVAALGAPVEIYTVPLAGATAPVTPAGTVTQGVAEFLGAAAAVQALAPGAAVIMGAGSTVLDMRTAQLCYGSLETGLMSAMYAEVLHELDIPLGCPSLATDARYLGPQNGYEKALKCLVTTLAGADLQSGVGALDSTNALFLPQIVVDAEIVAMVRRLTGTLDVSPTTVMGELIEQAGIGGSFLGANETRARVRAGVHFAPTVATHLPYDVWESRHMDDVDVATVYVERTLAEAAEGEPCLSEDQLRDLEAICHE
jgi:trimethylamine---corrinoid protein Co-methyltransferase